MATLIGAGSHATDIAHTYMFSRHVPHHDQYTDDGQALIIGVNDPQLRARISKQIDVLDNAWIHPDTFIGPECSIGAGTHVNYAVTMTRTTVGEHCTIGPAATICGDVRIGDRVLIGAGATICDRVTIGDDTTIGAGAVVLPTRTIPPGTTWVGVPAKQIR